MCKSPNLNAFPKQQTDPGAKSGSLTGSRSLNSNTN